MKEQLASITLGAGCFWCVEAVFQDLKGVDRVESGYCNGLNPDRPTYKEVCTGSTGYAEVLQVHYDPSVVSLETVLDVFWHTHNPTTLNQQGNDRGTQYRSGIYYENDEQKVAAESSKAKIIADGVYPDPIVTEIVALENYYSAEGYHQNYYKQNGGTNPYCAYVITPKVAKFRSRYKDLLK